MATRLDYPTGDLEYGQEVQVTKSTPIVSAGVVNASASQSALSTAAKQILIERSTRASALVLNTDSAITVYIGTNAQVSSSNGFPLAAGANVTLVNTAAWWAIAASGTPSLAIIEEWS